MEEWKNTRVAITGVCGTVGRELLRQIADAGPAEIIGLDNNESELFLLTEEYRERAEIRFYIADICDQDTLCRKFEGISIVLHAAALKHVTLCERPHGTQFGQMSLAHRT